MPLKVGPVTGILVPRTEIFIGKWSPRTHFFGKNGNFVKLETVSGALKRINRNIRLQ